MAGELLRGVWDTRDSAPLSGTVIPVTLPLAFVVVLLAPLCSGVSGRRTVRDAAVVLFLDVPSAIAISWSGDCWEDTSSIPRASDCSNCSNRWGVALRLARELRCLELELPAFGW